ncbi:peptidase inhibitor family I36 protein [Streptomyces sp. NPDC050625]|uniref:peptidase inhibitor family I36 protein n=1 Tax=Streptomyces sp. NPDC050625 TaxID=3154629 RepID=UPI003426122A
MKAAFRAAFAAASLIAGLSIAPTAQATPYDPSTCDPSAVCIFWEENYQGGGADEYMTEAPNTFTDDPVQSVFNSMDKCAWLFTKPNYTGDYLGLRPHDGRPSVNMPVRSIQLSAC